MRRNGHRAACTVGGARGEAVLTLLNLMDAVITPQHYRLDAALISNRVGGAATAITAAGGAGESAASSVAMCGVQARVVV